MSAACGLFIMLGLFVLGSDLKQAARRIAEALETRGDSDE